MAKYRRKSDGKIVGAERIAWDVFWREDGVLVHSAVCEPDFLDGHQPVCEPEFTDADFNRFRRKGTEEVVEARQWWPGKDMPPAMCDGNPWSVYESGTWGTPDGADIRMISDEGFRQDYEPIHLERRRWQRLVDIWNDSFQGNATRLHEWWQDVIVLVDGVYYVKDRELEKPAETIATSEVPTVTHQGLRQDETITRERWLGYGPVVVDLPDYFRVTVDPDPGGSGAPQDAWVEWNEDQMAFRIITFDQRLAGEGGQQQAGDAICVECEHIEEYVNDMLPPDCGGAPEKPDYVHGGTLGKQKCHDVNPDGKCPFFKRKAD